MMLWKFLEIGNVVSSGRLKTNERQSTHVWDIKRNRAACVGTPNRPLVRECLEQASHSGREGDSTEDDGGSEDCDCRLLCPLLAV